MKPLAFLALPIVLAGVALVPDPATTTPISAVPLERGVQAAAAYYDAGFRDRSLVVMLAISRAESGWRTDAIGDVHLMDRVWGPSVGISQIRSVNAQVGSGGIRDRSLLSDPYFNARSAWQLATSDRSWAHWTMFRNGRYLAYLGEAEQAIAALSTSSAGHGK